MTNRTDVEGTLARWFAVDKAGQIGVFTGAYAAWPTAVFTDYSIVEAADEFLSTATPVTKGVLTARRSERDRSARLSPLWESPPTPDFPLVEASQGLFSFDADLGYGGSTKYYLDAIPRIPVVLSSAHPTIQRAGRVVTFSALCFSDIEVIDIAEHVAFVVGEG